MAPQVNPATIPSDDVATAAAILARPVDDVPSEDAWQIAKGACEASNFIDAGKSWEEASSYMMGKVPSLKYQIQAEQLLKNLTEANNASDLTVVLGNAAICEAADRKT